MCFDFCSGGFLDWNNACDLLKLRGEGGGYEIPRCVGLNKDFGTVREWCWECGAGDESEAEGRLGKDWPDTLEFGICTDKVFGLGEGDLKERLRI